jgi:hypothetical protein
MDIHIKSTTTIQIGDKFKNDCHMYQGTF